VSSQPNSTPEKSRSARIAGAIVLLLLGILVLVIFVNPWSGDRRKAGNDEGKQIRSQDTPEDKAVALVHKLEGQIERDENAPGRPVVKVYLRHVTDAELKKLAALTKLQELGLRSTQVTDAGLKALAPLKNLHTLDLSNTKVTDAGLKELAPLKNLHTLKLVQKYPNSNIFFSETVTDQTLQSLRQAGLLHALEQATAEGGFRPKSPEEVVALDLSHATVTGVGLKELAPLKNLHTLNLSDTRVTGAGLKELAQFKNLHILYLPDTQATDAGLKELAKLKKLNTLHVWLRDKTLQSLRQAGLLHVLEQATAEGAKRPLSDEQVVALDLTTARFVTDIGLKELAVLNNLHTLKLPKNPYDPVTAAGLKELAPLKNLHTVNLGTLDVTDQVLQSLRHAGLLHTLDRATAEGGKRPLNAEQVVALDLTKTKISNDGLKELASLKHLKLLNLSGNPITANGLKELAPLQNLEELNLSATFTTDLALLELARLTKLQRLDLSSTRVTDANLLVLAPLKNLKSLDLRYTKVTDAGAFQLKQALPNCQINLH
jgi:Leucine-rich repeat (LRR) protein